jgi:hypothetical protein
MNLPELRTLLATWQDGSIREAELVELRDALPEVFEAAECHQRHLFATLEAMRTEGEKSRVAFDYDGFAGRFGY